MGKHEAGGMLLSQPWEEVYGLLLDHVAHQEGPSFLDQEDGEFIVSCEL